MATREVRVEVMEGDSHLILPTLPSGSFAACITDPNYPKNRRGGTTGRLKTWFTKEDHNLDPLNDHTDEWYARFEALLREVARIVVKGGWVIVFADEETADRLKPTLRRVLTYRQALVWDKEYIGMGYYFRHSHEFLLACTNGETKRYVTKHGTVFRHRRVHKSSQAKALAELVEEDIYPAEKPMPLLAEVLGLVAKPGERVIDPFMGGGSAVLAARSLGMDALGIDIQPEAVTLVKRRLARPVPFEVAAGATAAGAASAPSDVPPDDEEEEDADAEVVLPSPVPAARPTAASVARREKAPTAALKKRLWDFEPEG